MTSHKKSDTNLQFKFNTSLSQLDQSPDFIEITPTVASTSTFFNNNPAANIIDISLNIDISQNSHVGQSAY